MSRRLLIGALVGVVPLAAVAIAMLPANAEPAPRRIVNGWLPYYSMSASLASVDANSDLWRDASPVWYQATGATTIQRHTGAGDPVVVTDLRSRGILVIPSVTETLNAANMATLLSDPAQRTAHVQALTALVISNGYDGIDLDYESMNYGGTSTEKTAVRTGFVALANELGAALDAQGKLLSITVGARTATVNWWPVHDYPGLGAAADLFRIMAYDYHYAGSVPGAVAPLGWVDQVLSYAVTLVPKGKIEVGVPLYGFDWPRDPSAPDGWGTAKSLSFEQAEALRTSVGAIRQWSATDAAPHFTYTTAGVDHEVWYNDVDSTTAKMTLVEKYGIRGLVFWAVGHEDTRQWPVLRDYAVQETTSLRASAPYRVTYGTKIYVSGMFTTTEGTPVPAARVDLQVKPAGSTTWTKIGTAITSATGRVAIPYTPPTNTQFRLYAPATWAYAASTSRVVTTLVQWRVSATFDDATIAAGATARLRGTVAPIRSGTTVYRDQYINGTWTAIQSTTVAADGSYAFSFLANAAGTYSYRVRVPGTTLNATGYSATKTLSVS